MALLPLFALAQTSLMAASFYIFPTGRDTTGTGTLAGPYRSIIKANSVAVLVAVD